MANSDYQTLYLQKQIIEKRFECFKCDIKFHGLNMVCRGQLQPLDYIEPYQIEIIQVSGNPPKVFVKSPKIEYNPKIHMYKKGNLCLYYPPDLNWKANTCVATYTLPWINEWIVYYELYKISGVWEGPAAPHGITE